MYSFCISLLFSGDFWYSSSTSSWDTIRIPQDLAAMGFDNQPIAQALTISTINQPIKELEYKSITMIIKLINGDELIAQTVELSYTILSI
ncbi:hypothetical protein GA597_02960 [Staphylococcus haemolyticus]|uniref:Transcriptional regulator LacI/GalR-like sensor domain-containing protein n=4 Tax=Staphylococcus TaxID=1279 RepID=A0A7G3T411_9STAP|nr:MULTISPECIES: substrate-binding domain-containing protein [Bacilli]QJR98742.1 hypothetical protein [Staphylococcus arlettae]QJR98762.1 hypothetical protein [Staphylococcus equorum]AMN16457.1 hypothetical protein [Staphylococcus aureus]AVS02286.1 hypothetical protein C9J77_15145 [Staphylococcus aureus]MBM6053341.1 substrate-binding domain-containing protein [Staphylococcus epidermidis]